MKPTIYLPLAQLRPTGLRRTSASSATRFGAGRAADRDQRTALEGQQANMGDQRNKGAGSSDGGHTP
jgi:hypothetical protein